MGGKLSSRRRQNHHHLRLHDHDHDHHDQNQPQSLPPTTPSNQLSSSTSSHTRADNTNTNTYNSNINSQNNPIPFSSNSSINTTTILPPPPSYAFAAHAPYLTPPSPPPFFFPFSYNSYDRFMPMSSGWVPPGSANRGPPIPVPPPPTYIDHNHAKKIKNVINVHKDSIRLIVDEKNLDSHLVCFTFDALADGSISITYFAKEEMNCTFIPLYPEIHTPTKIPFEKGLGQKFCQSSGTGIDLGFFELDHLSKTSAGEDIFPLVICAEACLPSQPPPSMSPHAQITQAVLNRTNDGHFQVKVVKQILWMGGVRYELGEIYGFGNSNTSGFDDKETGKECIICMTEPKDTALMPCRHMCLCSECAKELRLQSNKCPICRQPIYELIEIIKINKGSILL